jgi:LacI family transcriptional regulator
MNQSEVQRMQKATGPNPTRPNPFPRVLLLVDTAAPFGRAVIQGIGRYALEHGPWSIQFVYRVLDSLPPQWIKDWRGDGIISRTVNAKQAKMLWATKLPLVELHSHPRFGIPQIRVDLQKEGRIAVRHFLDCGLRHFAFFSYGDAWWIKLHKNAFCEAVAEKGSDCHCYRPPASDRSMPYWRESQRPGLVKWLQSLPRPIGIFTAGDIHSAFLLDVCRENDISVPEEAAILGMGNDSVICEHVRPTLSSLDVDARRVGYEAAKLLDQMMAGKPAKEIVYVSPSHVVVRQSTDLVAIEDADVAQALGFIRKYACFGIDVARVTREAGLSRRSLERRFRQYVGRSPKAEIMRVRIERAKMLMFQTDQTSESIARMSGFASLEYFTRVFRRMVGMKPQAYRKMRRISRDLGVPEEI